METERNLAPHRNGCKKPRTLGKLICRNGEYSVIKDGGGTNPYHVIRKYCDFDEDGFPKIRICIVKKYADLASCMVHLSEIARDFNQE